LLLWLASTGVQLTNGTIGSICNLTLPVFAAIIGIYSGKEKFRWTTVGGVGLCIFGALILVLGKHGPRSTSKNAELGIFVLLLGSFSSALYYIIQKKSLTKYSAVFVTSWEYIFGLGFMLLSALLFADYNRPERWQLNKTGTLALTFTVLFNSVAKYLLNSISNKFVSATILTAFSTLVPVMTGVLAFVLLNSPFQLSYLGSFPVILGIHFVMKAREMHAADTSSNAYKSVYESDPY
jgi:drug/metabolite transporter (DMT)-like permease